MLITKKKTECEIEIDKKHYNEKMAWVSWFYSISLSIWLNIQLIAASYRSEGWPSGLRRLSTYQEVVGSNPTFYFYFFSTFSPNFKSK